MKRFISLCEKYGLINEGGEINYEDREGLHKVLDEICSIPVPVPSEIEMDDNDE